TVQIALTNCGKPQRVPISEVNASGFQKSSRSRERHRRFEKGGSAVGGFHLSGEAGRGHSSCDAAALAGGMGLQNALLGRGSGHAAELHHINKLWHRVVQRNSISPGNAEAIGPVSAQCY